MAATHAVTRELQSLLRNQSTGAHDRWRAWSAELMRSAQLTPALLSSVWAEVLDFDPALSDYIRSPVPVQDKAVIVAGSGKDTFQTFNVSTAASVLAASAGVPVIKGVSESVSAVSGAADVLDSLGIHIEKCPATIAEAIDSNRIAFISYAAFCPTYAGRYDGVFPVLSPFSFFMPAAVLAVDASRFLFGLAHSNVHLAAATIRTIRQDLQTGFVVATDIGPNQIMDEWADTGTTHMAMTRDARIETSRQMRYGPPDAAWRNAVGISELGAWNSRNVPWDQLEALRDQMFGFLRRIGLDDSRCHLRSHLDFGNLARAGKIARYLTRQDFLENSESLLELYDSHGLLGSEVGITVDSLYTVADVLEPAETGSQHILMVSGLEEAYFTELARLVLDRQRAAGELSLGWEATIGALYFRVLEGLGGYPKMSKSIPASGIHLGMSADELAERILSDEPKSQGPLLSAIELVSGWDEDDLEHARAAYHHGASKQGGWQKVKQRYLDDFATFAEQWNHSAP